MSPAQRKVVILPTSELSRAFRSKTAAMSTVDYDLEELATGMVHCLSNKDQEDQARFRHDFLKSLKDHGSFNRANTPDGEILAGAVDEYMNGIKAIVDRSGLYDEQGTLDFMFDRYLGDDMVLTEWPD